jgi:hypothetical protein
MARNNEVTRTVTRGNEKQAADRAEAKQHLVEECSS